MYGAGKNSQITLKKINQNGEKRTHHDSYTFHIFYSEWDHNLLNEHNSVLKKEKNNKKKTRQTQQSFSKPNKMLDFRKGGNIFLVHNWTRRSPFHGTY